MLNDTAKVDLRDTITRSLKLRNEIDGRSHKEFEVCKLPEIAILQEACN